MSFPTFTGECFIDGRWISGQGGYFASIAPADEAEIDAWWRAALMMAPTASQLGRAGSDAGDDPAAQLIAATRRI